MSEPYLAGSLVGQDEFLRVPNAQVIIDNREKGGCSAEEFAALAGRLASAQPKSKVKYWISVED